MQKLAILIYVCICFCGCAAFGWKPDPSKDTISITDTLGHIAKDGVLPTLLITAYRVFSNVTLGKRIEKHLKRRKILKGATKMETDPED